MSSEEKEPVQDILARSIYFAGDRTLSLRKEQVDRMDGEVFVQSSCIGISHGTEMLFYRGDVPGDIPVDSTFNSLKGSIQYPIKYGYVNAGIDEKKRRVFSFYPHQDRFFIAPEDLLILPDTMDFEDAIFIPNMETALTIHHDLHLEPGSVLLICGLGVIGLLIAELALRRIPGKVICVDRYEIRRNAAADLGAAVFDPDDPNLSRQIGELTEGRGVDWAVNVSTSGAGLQLCIDSLCFAGTVIEGSWYGIKPVTLRLGSNFHRNRLRIQSVQVSSISPGLSSRWTKARRMDTVFSLLDSVRPRKYITHRFSLDDAEAAFDLIATRPETTIQTILMP